MVETKNLMTTKELAKSGIVPFKEQTLRVYVMKNSIPFYRVGRSIFFSPSEVEKWIASQHVPAGGHCE